MVTLQIDTSDTNAIEEIKNFAMQKFNFKVKILENSKKEDKLSVDEKLETLKKYTLKKEGTLAQAFSSINKKIDREEKLKKLKKAHQDLEFAELGVDDGLK